MLAREDPQQYLDTALVALSSDGDWRTVLDALAAPIYMTDPEGAVTYWNAACVELAGRESQLGQDRWCVTWQIYSTTGERVPHEECPMADAIRSRKSVRDSVAIALRPDGSRIAFQPYPTPLFDRDGNFTGAVNMLIDVTEQQAVALSGEAQRCRRMADAMYDRTIREVLATIASGFEKTVRELTSGAAD
ncbi:MAG TPA: PAS domain-containing protein [Sphingomicrobium sp.]|nr:PAS domain-containing protein [Sphingomicrobium sp.]